MEESRPTVLWLLLSQVCPLINKFDHEDAVSPAWQKSNKIVKVLYPTCV